MDFFWMNGLDVVYSRRQFVDVRRKFDEIFDMDLLREVLKTESFVSFMKKVLKWVTLYFYLYVRIYLHYFFYISCYLNMVDIHYL